MGILQRLMAHQYDRIMTGYERRAVSRRHALLERIPRGARVLELGPGTGVNLELLAALGRTDVAWRGVEPNPYMRQKIVGKAEALARPLSELTFTDLSPTGHVEADAGSADVVLSTLVLCSVPDPAQMLGEIHRLLAPGGQFLFMEHVGAARGTGTRLVQTAVTPIWRRLADGCCLNRDTEAAIRSIGFANVEAETYPMHKKAAPFFVRPHIAGVATKSRP